jgi:phage-related protein
VTVEQQKRIHAEFFKTASGNEPVREALHEMGRPGKTQIGEDIRFVELNWRVDKPYVDRLRSGSGEFEKTIYEVRHTVEKLEFRTLFFVYGSRMVLVHLFQKTSKKTPKAEIDLAWDRMKLWVAEQKKVEAQSKKRGKKS